MPFDRPVAKTMAASFFVSLRQPCFKKVESAPV